VQDLSQRFDGRVFDYLLTRFTEPNELFGPFDIRKLREGELVTNVQGMLPEASFAFLDELLNANSAILNSLLLVLNERVFRRGRETFKLPLLMTVGASNRLPEDEALGALFDRFLLRVMCDNVEAERLRDVLDAGWRIDQGLDTVSHALSVDDVKRLHAMLPGVDLTGVRPRYVELVHRLRHAGISISDRRAVKLQRMMAASALLCGRDRVIASDMWVLRYIWDTAEQQQVLAEIVRHAIDSAGSTEGNGDGEARDGAARQHPRVLEADRPDPEAVARELDDVAARLARGDVPQADLAYLRDRVGVLASRVQWIDEAQQRAFLEEKIEDLWDRMPG
jgi:MoxR-like ATPase